MAVGQGDSRQLQAYMHAAVPLRVRRAAEHHRAPWRHEERAVDDEAAVGTHILGTVVNDPDGEVAKFTSYYGYYYNQYYEASPA